MSPPLVVVLGADVLPADVAPLLASAPPAIETPSDVGIGPPAGPLPADAFGPFEAPLEMLAVAASPLARRAIIISIFS